ncbi:hypothetical protein ACLKA6_014035 [Drosophila palustris]
MRTNADLKKQSVQTDYREYSNIDSNPRLKRDHYEVRKRRPKKKRQTLHLAKQVQHGKRQAFFNQGNDEKIYETFEEIHEHINEPSNEDGQVQASERYESHEETLSGGGVQSDEEQKQEQQKEESPVKIKVKHHHHHHHHNHIKEVIKTVPKPYKVEKIVHVPIEKIVEKIVHVPKIVNVTVEKIVHVPVEKIIEKIVHIPKAVHVPKPYIVEKIMEKIVHVPKPYPVLRTVPYPVEIKVPVTVEKKVPFPYKVEVERKVPVPYKVEVERKVPVYIQNHEPYKYEQTYPKNYKDAVQFNTEIEETQGTENYPRFPPYFYSNKMSPFKKSETPHHEEIQSIKQPTEQHTNIDYPKSFAPTMEQSTSESQFLPIKFLENNSQFNIVVADNNTSFDLNPQIYDNKYHELPFPFEFIQVQPVPFRSNVKLELPFPGASSNST